MADEYRTPGVYIQERNAFPNGIVGASTSVTAFLGRTSAGPVDLATEISSWTDFERLFGGLSHDLPLTYAVQQFYNNGGRQAWIVRLEEDSTAPDAPWLSPAAYIGDRAAKTGLHALDNVASLNLLCIPPDGRMLPDVPAARQRIEPVVRKAALDYCVERGAFFIMDPLPEWNDHLRTGDVADIDPSALGCWAMGAIPPPAARNAAVYVPTILCADHLAARRDPGTPDVFVDFAPCGAIAGQYCQTDADIGVWKAPAGLNTQLIGIYSLSVIMDDAQMGMLNPKAINALRFVPNVGNVIWGARTLCGADAAGDDYRYVPVRRLGLYIEQSISESIAWAAFEPNDERLWAQLRLRIESFMRNLWQQGAVLDQFVKCDATTTTLADIDVGVVNILIGYAPIKPAEFVVINIQQATAKSD